MHDTAFSVPADRLDRFSALYTTDPDTGATTMSDAPAGEWSAPPAFQSGGGGLVSTVDDYLAFARMLLHDGRSPDGRDRILSRPLVELMTTDQLTPRQKAIPALVPGFWEDHGWGFGVAVVTRRTDFPSVGAYFWDGGMGSVWLNDPRRDLILILLTNRAWESPNPPPVVHDFHAAAYQAIDD